MKTDSVADAIRDMGAEIRALAQGLHLLLGGLERQEAMLREILAAVTVEEHEEEDVNNRMAETLRRAIADGIREGSA